MNDITTLRSYRCDLNSGPCVAELHQPLMHQDALADTFRVAVCRGHEAVDLTGMTVWGYLYLPATKQTLPLTGAANEHYASVTLTGDCYAMPGWYSLVIQLMDGNVRHTVLKVDFAVKRTGSEILYPPGSFPTVADLIARIEALEKGGGGGSGEDGGYYTPGVDQTNDSTMRVSFAPSKAGMPGVSPVNITLPQGPKGETPVKGVDYHTPADQEAIVQQVIAALGTPVFGMVDAENNIILTGELADGTYKIVYEDAQGNRTQIGTLGHDADAPNYTNQIPISTDTDGSIYNGKGYAEATRISSSSGNPASVSASVATPAFATGFIPIKAGDVVRLKNCWIDTKEIPADTSPYGNQTWGLAITFYKSDKSYDSQSFAWTNMGVATNQVTATIDSNGYVTEFVYNGSRPYMRMTLASNDPAQAIVTINKPIV